MTDRDCDDFRPHAPHQWMYKQVEYHCSGAGRTAPMTDTPAEPTPELERAWDRLMAIIADGAPGDSRALRIMSIMSAIAPGDVTFLFDVALRAQHDE